MVAAAFVPGAAAVCLFRTILLWYLYGFCITMVMAQNLSKSRERLCYSYFLIVLWSYFDPSKDNFYVARGRIGLTGIILPAVGKK